MANYCGFSRTNYFRVTDEKRYSELFSRLSAEDEIKDFSGKDGDGVMWHGFGAYSPIECPVYIDDDGNPVDPSTVDNNEDWDTEDDMDWFVTELKKILPADEAFILMEVGYEKLRYLTGWAMVATRDKPTEYINLPNSAVDAARKLLGDDEWTTKMEY